MGLTRTTVALAATTLLLALTAPVDAGLTYPKCAPNGVGCCAFGSGMMKSPGYAVVRVDVDTIITCSHGTLQCFKGNPNLRASQEGRDPIDCPDFAALEESRSEVEFLDGVKESTKAAAAAGPATVHAVGSA